MADPTGALPLANLQVGDKVIAVQRGQSSQFTGTLARLEPVRNGLRTLWLRRDTDPADSIGIGLQIRLADSDWTFYPQPDIPTGQGPAPAAGGRRKTRRRKTRKSRR